MPFLKDIIGETYVPKPNDEKRFVEKHVVKLFQNMYADSEYDKLFKATNISTVRRSKERHGYDVGNNIGDGSGADAKVYEEKEINESRPNFKLADVLDMAARYHEKNDLDSIKKTTENDITSIKQILDDMLDFLAEMPVDKYHDYREFRSLHLREYLIHKFIQKNVRKKVKKNNCLPIR